jgi:hypothetical protein
MAGIGRGGTLGPRPAVLLFSERRIEKDTLPTPLIQSDYGYLRR